MLVEVQIENGPTLVGNTDRQFNRAEHPAGYVANRVFELSNTSSQVPIIGAHVGDVPGLEAGIYEIVKRVDVQLWNTTWVFIKRIGNVEFGSN